MTTTLTSLDAFVVDVPESFTLVDTGFETAANWDAHEVQPGEYPVRLTNINGTPWNPDPGVHTPGYIGNTGPYYATVTVTTVLRESYRLNRLLTESRASTTRPDTATTFTHQFYAYELRDGATAFHSTSRAPAAVFRAVTAVAQ